MLLKPIVYIYVASCSNDATVVGGQVQISTMVTHSIELG